ncbi:MAG TPA: outer membrane beta-barrel family protein [Flavisolibacter sp.]|jgi:hypothetical protein|nr:outer membrane beta-barrel family protein [Flavisolibacter sp.]
MKKFYLLALVILASLSPALAQKVSGTVKGTLQDSLTGTPLTDATVSIVRLKDSSLISFTLTDRNGRFEIKNIEAGAYSLIASFTSLITTRRKFTITPEQPLIEFDLIRMDRNYKALDEVVVKDEAPVKVKGDTIAYNADAFKTKPNATVEDLLKKLPGVQVDKDGTVKAQGEQVQKVYVDGKEFFNNDPKLATKNITADMVDQVEVYDDMSEQAKFNKIDDGSRSKAINLKLKKDKKKGLFGKAYAGYGTEQRWDAGLNANLFKGAMQASVIAKNNNTNNIGFSFTDMIGMFGGGNGGGGNQSSGGGIMMRPGGGGGGNTGGLNLGTTGGGITKSSQYGFNYRDTWSTHFDVNGSYFFNHVNTDNDRKSFTTSYGPGYNLLTNDQIISKAENDNHRFNLNMIYTIDSFNSLIYNPNVSYQRSYNTHSIDDYFLDSVRNEQRYRTNQGQTSNMSNGDGYSWTNNLIWRKKFRRAGRTLSVNLSNTLGQTQRKNYTMTDAQYFNSLGAKYREENTNTLYTTDNETNNYGVSVSYTEPLARDKVLEFNYGHNRNQSQSDREILNYNGPASKYALTDSNYFRNENEWDRFGTNLRIVKKKYNYQLGFAVQQTTLESNNISKKTQIKQNFTNLFPTASFNYQFARSRSLRFNYRGNTRQPSTTQLQDIIDSTNYRNQYQGNPGLKQEFSNNFTLSYNFFDAVKFRNLFAFVTFSTTQNKIANSIRRLPGGIQFTTPVNVNGVYNLNGVLNLGFPIKQMKGGNFNTNTRVSYFRDANLVELVKNYTRNLQLGEDLRLNYNYKEKLDLGIGVSVNYFDVKYSVQPANNTSYFTHTYSADITYTFPKGFILSTDFDYTLNTGRTTGFNQNYAILNGALAKEVFKNKKGEIKLSCFDILNQNRSIVRNITDNYVEDVQNSVLKRFFMLTFTYKLNRMGGKAMPGSMDRGGRSFRIGQ